MQRNKVTYPLATGQAEDIKRRMLNWANQFSILLFLDSNSYSSPYGRYECLLAVGDTKDCRVIQSVTDSDALTSLQQAHDTNPDWFFGHVNYDYKDELEPKLSSSAPLKIGFPRFHFFVPGIVCYIDKDSTSITIESFTDAAAVYNAVITTPAGSAIENPRLQFSAVVNKEQYLDTIAKLRSHIADGDCYEINYCNEGYCEQAIVEPLQVFKALNTLSPAPFAAYYRLQDKHLMCASPERYLLRTGDEIISQPIKGTARRDKDAVKDEEIKEKLRSNIKERAENVMIVDLVRNDMARCCEPASVKVNELFGIYTFPQVHQMISTISGRLKAGIPFTDAIRCSFPMGSMTGAPKYKVMELIETYERSRRELFSGTVGYITPSGDFDFNVIIRSLFYNATSQYLAYQTGGAITYDSDATQEWEEMRLKAWALERIFAGPDAFK